MSFRCLYFVLHLVCDRCVYGGNMKANERELNKPNPIELSRAKKKNINNLNNLRGFCQERLRSTASSSVETEEALIRIIDSLLLTIESDRYSELTRHDHHVLVSKMNYISNLVKLLQSDVGLSEEQSQQINELDKSLLKPNTLRQSIIGGGVALAGMAIFPIFGFLLAPALGAAVGFGLTFLIGAALVVASIAMAFTGFNMLMNATTSKARALNTDDIAKLPSDNIPANLKSGDAEIEPNNEISNGLATPLRKLISRSGERPALTEQPIPDSMQSQTDVHNESTKRNAPSLWRQSKPDLAADSANQTHNNEAKDDTPNNPQHNYQTKLNK